MHTPGEWRLGRDGSVVTDQQIGLDETGAGAMDPTYRGGEVVCESASPANAALIRTAPDMYDLLRDLVQSGTTVGPWVRRRAQELLDRADGLRS